MDAFDLLLNRVSVPRLREPAPDAVQRDRLFRAALRAPDHGQLRPWRFLTIEGAGREALGEVLARAVACNAAASDELIAKARKMPLRAPLLIVVIASPKDHPKVPVQEQHLAAACAAHGMLLAAHAEGLGAVWRTGDLAYHPEVERGLGLVEGERILGFIYVGTPDCEPRRAPELAPDAFVSAWPAH